MDSLRKSLTSARKKKSRTHTDHSEPEFSTSEFGTEISEQDNMASSSIRTEYQEKKTRKKVSSSAVQEKILAQLENMANVIGEQQKINMQQIEFMKLREQEVALARSKISLAKEPEREPEPVKEEIKEEIDDEPVISVVPSLLETSDNVKHEVKLEKYSRDVRRAFQVATSQLILLVLLVLGYYTFSMIDEYLPPFFWAVLLSIMLRKPKKALMKVTGPMKNIEDQNLGYFGTIKSKFMVMVGRVGPKYIKALVGMVVIGKLSCWIVSWGCWVPWFSLAVGVVVLALLVMIMISITNSASLEGFFTTVLIFGFLILLVLFAFTFGFKAVTETGDFAFKIQNIVEQKIHDPKWGTMMIEYGITEESISEAIDTGRAQLETWAEQQGYNITEIEETILVYGSMLSGNDTIEEPVIVANDTAVVESSYMDYIPDIGMDELQEYYNSAMEIIDFEAVGNVAGSIGGFLFGTGSGVLGVFSSIASSLLGAVDVLLQFIVFIGALFYFMESEESVVCMVVKIVPVSKRQQEYLSNTIQQNIIQVFVTSLLLSFSHGLATLIYFSVFDLDFAYSSAFIVGAMALFPLTSAWLIYAPTLLIAYLNGSAYVLYIAIGLFLLEQAVGFVDEKIYQLIPGSSPYLTGIGLAVGVSTYGVQGVLIGPMLIVTTKTLFDIFCMNVSQPEEEKTE